MAFYRQIQKKDTLCPNAKHFVPFWETVQLIMAILTSLPLWKTINEDQNLRACPKRHISVSIWKAIPCLRSIWSQIHSKYLLVHSSENESESAFSQIQNRQMGDWGWIEIDFEYLIYSQGPLCSAGSIPQTSMAKWRCLFSRKGSSVWLLSGLLNCWEWAASQVSTL